MSLGQTSLVSRWQSTQSKHDLILLFWIILPIHTIHLRVLEMAATLADRFGHASHLPDTAMRQRRAHSATFPSRQIYRLSEGRDNVPISKTQKRSLCASQSTVRVVLGPTTAPV